MTYKKILKCTMCGEDMEARTANRLRCADCKKIYRRGYTLNWLYSKPERMKRHKDVEKIYRSLEETKKNRAIQAKEYRRKNVKKIKAYSLSQGIKIKTCCELCGEKNNLLHKHHWNYNKPLLVSTLCTTCHAIQHQKFFRNSKYAGGITVGI